MGERILQYRFLVLLICLSALPGCFEDNSPTATGYLEQAKDHIAEDHLTAALISLKNALRKQPKLIEARVLLGMTHVALNNGAEAEKQIRYARKLGRDGHEERVALIQALLLQNRSTDALGEFPDPLSGDDKQLFELHILRGRAHLEADHLLAAAEDVQSAFAIEQSAPAYAGLTRIAAASADFTSADLHLLDGLKQFPEDPQLLILNGERFLRLQDFAASAEEFKRAIAHDDSNRTLLGRLGLGRALIGQDKLAEAKKVLHTVVERMPESRSAILLSAFVSMRLEDYTTAKVFADHVLNGDPDNLMAMGIRGTASYHLQDYEQANRLLSRYIEQEPEDAGIRQLLAETKLRLDFPDEAHDLLQSTQQVDNNSMKLHTLAGHSALLNGQRRDGLHHFARAVETEPGNAAARGSSSAELAASGKPDDAKDHLNRARDRDPDIEPSRQMYGLQRAIVSAMIRNQRFEGKAEPENAAARGSSSSELAASGKPDDAKDHLNRALDRDPDIEPSLPIYGVQRDIISALIRDQRFEEALTAALEMQRRHPEIKDGHVFAGIAYLGLKRATEARAQFHKARELVPGAPDASTNLAKMELINGNLEQAKAYLSDVITHFPNHYDTLISLAAIEARQNNADRTEQFLARAVAGHPNKARARIFLARFYIGQGEAAKALAVAKDGLIQNGDDPQLLLVTATAQIETGQVAEAIPTLEHLISLAPEEIDARLMLADAYRQAGDRHSVIRTLISLLEIEPDNLTANLALARALLAERKVVDANQIVEGLAPAYPNNTEVLQLRGQIALSQQRPQEAVGHFRAARKSIDNQIIALGLASALWQSSQFKQAVVILDDWLSRNTADSLALLQLVKYLKSLNQRDRAKQQLQIAVQNNPNMWIAHNELAWLLFTEGKQDQAVVHAEQAYNLAPQHPFVLDTLGVIRLARNDAAGAVQLLRTAFDLRPTNQDIGFHLAQALSKNGEPQRAQQTLLKILTSDNDFENRKAAETLLAELGG